jgi:uncharacterized membrane protein YagU involved in acid resistance
MNWKDANPVCSRLSFSWQRESDMCALLPGVSEIMNILRLLLGFICGVVATGPMSVVMVLWHRRLPIPERYPLPPREITTRAVEAVAGRGKVDSTAHSAITWLAHFGYGGAAGAIYAAMEKRVPVNAAVRGPLFGLLVWGISYLGLLPGLRILTPATEHPAQRNALMIVAHLIWGWFLATVYQVLFGDLWRESTAFHQSSRPFRDSERPLLSTGQR